MSPATTGLPFPGNRLLDRLGDMALTTGTRLGPYEITAPIGAGGMGEVYSARDTRLDRQVAIKVLPPDFAHDAVLLERFQREAKTISSLNHPHICTLFDVGEEEGVRFLVMELLEGEPLVDRVAKGALPLDQVLKLGAQIAEALDCAHRQGIVHRDLKPANVMLTRTGAKLLDFGLARQASARAPVQAQTEMATQARPLTEQGTILGTFQYMAPEQLEGLEADARTDIFALGALLYEMATGQRAFQGASRTSLIAAIVSSQPEPISQVTKMTPPALDHVVRKCLEKDPEDRWQSAQDVATQLRWLGEAGSQAGLSTAVTIRRKTREKLAWGLAGILATVLVVSNLFWVWTAPQPPRRIQLSIPTRTNEYVDTGTGVISPDGLRVVLPVQKPEGEWVVAVREFASATVTFLSGAEDMRPLCWSPDGSEIALRDRDRIKMIEVAGGTIRDVAEVKGIVRGAAWNEDDVILFAVEGDGIYRISAIGGAKEKIVSPDTSRFEIAPSFPTFLSDGNRFLYLVTIRDPSQDWSTYKLRAGALDATETTLVGDMGSEVALLDSGHLVHVADGTLMATRFDEEALELVGRPIPIADGVFYFMPTGSAFFSAARNGTILYKRREINGSLVWFDANGAQQGVLAARGGFGKVDISPDGQQAALDLRDPRNGTSDVWLYGLERSTTSRLTVHPAEEASPIWTPSGNAIIFYSDRLRRPDIFIKDLDGAGDENVLVGTDDLEFNEDVSPDGRHLLYSSDQGGTYGLWVLEIGDPESGRAFVSAPGWQAAATFSPEGRLVAYASRETGRSEIWVKPFPEAGRSVQISTEGGMRSAWARTGRTLYFALGKKLFSVDLSTAEKLARPEPRLLFETPQTIGDFDVAPDGRFLMVLRDDSIIEPNNVIVNWSPLED